MLKAMRQWFDEMNKKGDIQQILNRSSKPKIKTNGEEKSMEFTIGVNINENIGSGYKYNENKKDNIEKIDSISKVKVVLKADNKGGFIIYDAYPDVK